MKTSRQPTDAKQYWDIVEKINRLERSSPRVVTTSFSAVSSIDIGSFDGDNITGVRITGSVKTASTGGNTQIRVRPNGTNPVSVAALVRQVYWDTAVSGLATPFASNFANAAGMLVAITSWATAANSVWWDGVLYTPHLGGIQQRRYLGLYTNLDQVTNSQQQSQGTVGSTWNDNTTTINSLVLGIDNGTFSGRVTVEAIP